MDESLVAPCMHACIIYVGIHPVWDVNINVFVFEKCIHNFHIFMIGGYHKGSQSDLEMKEPDQPQTSSIINMLTHPIGYINICSLFIKNSNHIRASHEAGYVKGRFTSVFFGILFKKNIFIALIVWDVDTEF